MAKKKGVSVKGSWNHWLESFKPGERRYTGTTLEKFKTDTTKIHNKQRFTLKMKEEGYKFSVKLFTAVGSDPRDVRYILCTERIK